MECDICGWVTDELSPCECGRFVCSSCFYSKFSEQDRYDILKQIGAPDKLTEDICKVLDLDDPRSGLCTICFYAKYHQKYVGVVRYDRGV